MTHKVGLHSLVGAVLLLLVSGVPDAARAKARPSVEVLEQSPDRTRLRMSWPTPQQRGHAFAVALPSARAPQVVVRRLDAVSAADSGLEDPGSRRGVDRAAADIPERAVHVSPPRRFRGVWVCTVSLVSPFGSERDGFRLLRSVEIDLIHAPAPGEFTGPGRTLGPDSIAWPLRSVVNPAAAAGFHRASESRAAIEKASKTAGDTFSRSQRWMRIEVDRTGLYRITHRDLELRLSSEASEIDPATLRLFSSPHLYQAIDPDVPGMSWEDGYELVERAIHVEAGSPTTGLVPGDEILFYAAGPEEWMDRHDPSAGRLDHVEHEYADRIALWLTWELIGEDQSDFTFAPRRMSQVAASPTTGFDRVASAHRERLHVEDNREMAFPRFLDHWRWARIAGGDPRTFRFDTDHVLSGGGGLLRTGPIGERNRTNDCLTAQLGGTSLGERCWSPYDQRFSDTHLMLEWQGVSYANGGTNDLRILNTSPVSAGRDWVEIDGFDIEYDRQLASRGGYLEWVVFETETADERVRFELIDDEGGSPGWSSSSTRLVETSDPFAPILLTGFELTGNQMRFERDLVAGMRHHFLAAQDRSLGTPAEMRLGRPRLVREEILGGGGHDYVIVTPQELAPAADELAALRSAELDDEMGQRIDAPSVTVVDLQDVYDNFGYGVKEPAALRNFLKFVYQNPVARPTPRRLTYAVFMGDASRDYRERVGASESGSEKDLCPTFIQTHWPSYGSLGFEEYANDDWLGSFDAPIDRSGFYAPLDMADLALGRVPAGNLADARRLVGRIDDHVRRPAAGSWRNRVILVADDELALAAPWRFETDHVDQCEFIADALMPPELDASKLYLTEYPAPPGPRSKPSAKADLKRRWSEGSLIVHYIGHGSPSQLADEAVLQIQDVSSLTNGSRLPLFLALSCDVAIFDSPFDKSMSEQLVLSTRGGAVATIAASQITFIGFNESLTDSLYSGLWPDRGAGPSQPIGVALRDAKLASSLNFAGNLSLNAAHNAQKYVIFGDPAMRLPSPNPGVVVSGELADSLLSGRKLDLSAGVPPEANGGAGGYEVQVREAQDHSGYSTMWPPGDPDARPASIDYALPGNAFFNGLGSFSAEDIDLEVPTPVQMRQGPDGRVRVLLTLNGEANEMFVGLSDPVPVVRSASSSDDIEGPAIGLSFSTGSSVVAPGDTLLVTVADSSGINVLASQPGNRISVDFDEPDFPVDLSSLFRLDEGRYDRGELRYELPGDLDPGDHTLTLSAADMQGNLGSATASFTLRQTGQLDITDVLAFPNPFSGSTRFVMDLTEAAEISLSIHSLDGRAIRRLQGVAGQRGSFVLDWDGLDFRGDEIANGTYLYTVRAKFLQAAPVTIAKSGRIVRMR